MAQRAPQDPSAVITDARYPKSLDVETRTTRYLWTMLLRVVCFVAMMFVPGIPAKIACLVGAAVLPAIAVLLANAADNHKPPPVAEAPDPTLLPALSTGTTIRGTVVDEAGHPATDG